MLPKFFLLFFLRISLASAVSVPSVSDHRRNKLEGGQFRTNNSNDNYTSHLPTTHRFLNNQTAKFAVNGSSLPYIDFDIGESYAGSLPNGPDSTLWFWFVPSINPAASNDIVLWLTGGPGCSSLDGFFHENGPVTWKPGTYRPARNTYAWNNLTNVVWVDQPVGTGFSNGPITAKNENDVAMQFLPFWRNFIDTFGLHGSDVYTTGESYAGMYIPFITDAMLCDGSLDYYNVKGTMLYDPVIGNPLVAFQLPLVTFLDFHRNVILLNDSFLAYIHTVSEQCGFNHYMETALTFPPSGPLPPIPNSSLNSTILSKCNFQGELEQAVFALNPCFNYYQVAQPCPVPWDVLGDPYSKNYLPPGYAIPYFNQPAVKAALHAPLEVDWIMCPPSPNPHPVFLGNGDNSTLSATNGGPLAAVIEKTGNVIISHGTLDMVLLMNGTLAILQNMTWNGAQGFSSPVVEPLYVPYHEARYISVNPPAWQSTDAQQHSNVASMAGAGVLGSCTGARGLTFCIVDGAGHQVPEWQPSVAYRQLEVLLGLVSSVSKISAFTTQPGIPQPNVERSKGNALVLRRGRTDVKVDEIA